MKEFWYPNYLEPSTGELWILLVTYYNDLFFYSGTHGRMNSPTKLFWHERLKFFLLSFLCSSFRPCLFWKASLKVFLTSETRRWAACGNRRSRQRFNPFPVYFIKYSWTPSVLMFIFWFRLVSTVSSCALSQTSFYWHLWIFITALKFVFINSLTGIFYKWISVAQKFSRINSQCWTVTFDPYLAFLVTQELERPLLFTSERDRNVIERVVNTVAH